MAGISGGERDRPGQTQRPLYEIESPETEFHAELVINLPIQNFIPFLVSQLFLLRIEEYQSNKPGACGAFPGKTKCLRLLPHLTNPPSPCPPPASCL